MGKATDPPVRYLRPADGLLARYADTPRPLHFDGASVDDWRRWRRAFRRAVLRYLGPMPDPVPLNAEVTHREDCGAYVRERVVFDSEAYASVPCWVLTPKAATPERPAPGMMCLHGHGPEGKDALVGVRVTGEPSESLIYQRFAHVLAERGYVCIAPDWRGFGERMDTDAWVRRPGRDGCNVYHLGAGYFGFNSLALQIHDGRRTLDYLLTRPEVNPRRIGAMGLSFGGTMTTYLSALDTRIKCAVIGCYLSTLQDALERANFCGAQFMPGLGLLGDIADVAGLIAPRPMLAEMGERDLCFTIDDAQAAYDHVARIYAAAGVPDRCAQDRWDGDHEIHGVDSYAWLDRWLKPRS